MKGQRCGRWGRRWRAYTIVDEGTGEADPVRWTMMAVKVIWCGGQASHWSGSDAVVSRHLGVQGAEGRPGGVWGALLRRRTRFGGLPWLGGSGRGRGGALGKNVGGKEGKTMELPKQPFSVHVAGVKQEYRRAKLLGARYFDVSGKFESFWRPKLSVLLLYGRLWYHGREFICFARKKKCKFQKSMSPTRNLDCPFNSNMDHWASASKYHHMVQFKWNSKCVYPKYDDKNKNVYVYE
jgi:hypothetical protein